MINAIITLFAVMQSWVDSMWGGLCRSALESIIDTDAFEGAKRSLLLIGDNINTANAQVNAQGVVTVAGWTSGSAYRAMWDIVNKVLTNITLPVGIALVTTFFIMSLIEMGSRDNTTLEHYIKEFMKLIIAITVITNSWDIICRLVAIGEKMLDAVQGSGIDSSNAGLSVAAESGYASWSLSSLLAMALPWLVKKIAVIALYIAAFMRALDIAWRAAFFPIGAANMFEGGTNSPGVKYIKGLFGALLAGAVMYIMITLMPTIMGAAFAIGATNANNPNDPNNTTGIFAMTGALLGTVGAMFGASSKVKEILS